jgi:hypothetical protein
MLPRSAHEWTREAPYMWGTRAEKTGLVWPGMSALQIVFRSLERPLRRTQSLVARVSGRTANRRRISFKGRMPISQ